MAAAPVSHRSSPQTPTRHRRSRTGQSRAALCQLPRGATTDARRLSASEVGLTNILREVARDDLAIDADLACQGNQVPLPEGTRSVCGQAYAPDGPKKNTLIVDRRTAAEAIKGCWNARRVSSTPSSARESEGRRS
jgi:hypothetical protein